MDKRGEATPKASSPMAHSTYVNHTPGPVTSLRSALPHSHSRNMLRLRCAQLACTKAEVAYCGGKGLRSARCHKVPYWHAK